MIQNLDSLIITLIGTGVIIIVLFFLPALLELKRPKDAGPRLIGVNTSKTKVSSLIHLIDIEEQQKFAYGSITPILSSLLTLQDLEV